MRADDIRRHLQPYVMARNRTTTINNAFASALAPCTEYDLGLVRRAISMLGQSPDSDLTCIYCGRPAETWDHLVGLVKNSTLRGYGHQLGNLVPCCKTCNSRKGGKDWRHWLKEAIADETERTELEQRLATYLQSFAKQIDLVRLERESPSDLAAYNSLREQVLEIMHKADALAERLRQRVVQDGV